jgi:cytochrome c556
MRNLILLLVGIAVGAFAAVNVVNALRQRDAYARGLMNVMQHHQSTLRQELQRKHCDANTTAAALAGLQQSANGLEEALYPDAIADAPFREYAQSLRDAVTATSGSADCPSLAPRVGKIGAACDACHRQYR